MKTLEVEKVIKLIMQRDLNISEVLFYDEQVGYLIIDEICFENEGIEVKNNYTNISQCLCFDEKLYLKNS